MRRGSTAVATLNVALLAAYLAFALLLDHRTVDLAGAMRPFAARELLDFRDDTHWDARGNRVAAERIARRAFAR